MEPSQAIDRFLDAVNSHDLDRLTGSLAPDFVFEDAAGAGLPSIQALVEEVRLITLAFPDISFRPVRRTVDGGKTYLEFRAVGTHQGEFLNVPPTGTLAVVSGVFTLETNGTVRRLRLAVDFGGLRRQLLVAARAVPTASQEGAS